VGHFPYPSIPLPSQVTLSVLPPYDVSAYSPKDAENDEVVKKINQEIIEMMQKEMDRLAEGRIPIIGKLFDKD